tara:strand:+ start:354 stop:626 length:273 start_codon:yes stop_codon:yes gene_type:complete
MAIGVNVAKAKGLQKDRFRQVRGPLLEGLDIDYQKADEAADASAKTTVATKKQALRDVTSNATLDAASTEAEVRAVWDTAVLGTRPPEHT